MKEKLIVWTIASLLPIALFAASVEVSSTGPSGQGDLSWKAKATGVTNFAMGTGGLYNVTIDPRYPISGTATKQTGAVTATAVVTPQAPATVTPTISITINGDVLYDSTGAACTNSAGVASISVTSVTATCSALPDFVTNATVAVSIVGGDAVMTNATCAITPDLASNGVVAVSVTGGDAVVTNVSMTVP